jgi:hypothetical protein
MQGPCRGCNAKDDLLTAIDIFKEWGAKLEG